MKIKKALALLLALCLTLAMVPASAFAEGETSGTCGENLTWTFDESTGTLTISGNGEMTSSPWSKIKDQIIHINIEEGATSIRDRAFENCRNLLDVHFPETLRSIGEDAFQKCKKLSSIRIPDATKYFGYFAFNDCPELKRVDYSNLRNWCLIQFDSWYSNPLCNGADLYFDGVIARNIEIPDDFDGVGVCQFQGCASITNVTIPMGVTRINAIAFEGCKNLVSVSISDTVNFIGDYAFESSGIKSLRIPDTVTAVTANLCHWCYDLEEVTIGRDVTRIEGAAFNMCTSLERISYRGDRPSYYGTVAFSFTPGIKEIFYPAGNASWQEYLAGYSGSLLYKAYSVNDYYDGSYEKPPVDHGDTIVFNGHKYVRYDVDESLTWEDAKEYCETLGGHLATITSEAEQNAVESIVVGGKSDQYWLGADRTFSRFSEGDWITGEDWTYENWVTSKSHRFCSNLTMVRVSNSDTINDARALGRWDIASGKNYGFICEFEDVDNSDGLILEHSTPEKEQIYSDSALVLQFNQEIELDFSTEDLTANKGIHIYNYETDKEVRALNIQTISSYYANGDPITDGTFTVSRAFSGLPVGKYYILIDKGFIRAKNPDENGVKAIFEGISDKDGLWFDYKWSSNVKLSDLEPIDFLAFSDLSYWAPPAEKGITIREMIGSKWNEKWYDTYFTYADIFGHIADWQVLYWKEGSQQVLTKTGFFAYTFGNGYYEKVIAYRGSELNTLMGIWTDGVKNDLWSILGECSPQIDEAMDYAQNYLDNIDNVAVTGHSLGGGLAEIVSAKYGFKCESFDSAPFLDVAYWYYFTDMSNGFTGINNWNMVDHANEEDTHIGNRESEHIKPKIEHKNNYWSPLKFYQLKEIYFYPHLVQSLVRMDSGKPTLTVETKTRNVYKYAKQRTSLVKNAGVMLGTSRGDTMTPISENIFVPFSHCVMGGNGNDTITTDKINDRLLGGKGDDDLYGGNGSDTYFYRNGDGLDTIYDPEGWDTLYLLDFDSSDKVTITDNNDCAVVCVNGKEIVKIKKTRHTTEEGEDYNVFSVIVDGTNIILDAEKYLTDQAYFSRFIKIACPVNIEIIEKSTGKVVHTLLDGEVGNYYTDYGIFYIYPEDETDEYVKALDLIDGYDLRIVGYDAGTMDIALYDSDGFNLSDPYYAENVEVTPTMTATIEEVGEQKNLVIDYDGDGVTDSVVPLAVPVVVSFDANGGTGEMAEVSVAAGGAYELPECGFIAPEGQTFQGWDVNGTVCAPGEKVTVTEDVTVKALWSAASGEVTPPSGEPGGSQTPPEPSDLPLPPVVPPSSSEQTGSTAPSTTPEGPAKTGDFSAPALWAGMMAVSALVIMLILPRKNKHE